MKLLCVLSLTATAALMTSGCALHGFGSIGPVASAPVVPEAPPTVVYGAFLDGPIGQKLTQADRDKALAAEEGALASGQRKTWKGDGGIFGYVEPAAGPAAPLAADGIPPAAPASDDACRAFTSTIYIGGRPQTGRGRGCANPDGTYRIVG